MLNRLSHPGTSRVVIIELIVKAMQTDEIAKENIKRNNFFFQNVIVILCISITSFVSEIALLIIVFKSAKASGAPGWLSRLSIRLWLRS